MLLLTSCPIRYRHSHFVSVAAFHAFFRKTYHVSSPSFRTVRTTTNAQVSAAPANKPSIEPWIQPYSLRQTLEEHRAANRSGRAFNGYPVKSQVIRKRGSQKAVRPGKKENHKPFKRLQIPGITTDALNYRGVSVSVLSNWAIKGNLPEALRRPWIRVLEQMNVAHGNKHASQRLTDEILAYSQYASPTLQEQDAVQQVIKDAFDTLAKIPDCVNLKIGLVGSRTTGLETPLSDIDLDISHPRTDRPSRVEVLHMLRNICKAIRRPDFYESQTSTLAIQTFRQGRVPLIDCQHLNSGLNVQIQSTGEGFAATEIMKAYLAEYPTLIPLFRIVKQMLDMRGLTDGVRGGTTSYPLFHMIAASLRIGSTPKQDLGSQLLHFLDFYSELDVSATAIQYYSQHDRAVTSIHPNDLFLGYDPFACQPQLVPRVDIADPSPMYLQDPANPGNNLGRGRSLIKHVQATFIDAREQIRRAMKIWDEMHSCGLDMKLHGSPILTWCIEGDYSYVEEMRQQLRGSLALPCYLSEN